MLPLRPLRGLRNGVAWACRRIGVQTVPGENSRNQRPDWFPVEERGGLRNGRFGRKRDAAPDFIPFSGDSEDVWSMRRKLVRDIGLALLAAPAFLHAAEVISIGSTPQLFVDDYLVESMTELERTFHRPRKYSGKPRPDRSGTLGKLGDRGAWPTRRL